jgi:hypothetical protein
MLRQDGVFDRSEEGRVDAHTEHRREHQRNALQQQAGAADKHDENLRRLHQPDDPRLVMVVG